MSTEWQKLKLSSLGTFDRGKSKHRPRDAAHLYGGPYPFIQTGDVTAAGGRITSFRQTYSEAGLAQSKLWPAGTLCITIAANIAETALLTFPACFPDSVVGFTADETKADVRYIEYVFRAFRDAVKRRAYGSVQENINLEVLRDLEFPIPSLQVQKHIAEFLTHFDDRIALLRETNATLEAIAQALFKSWFVDFDPVHARARGEHPAGLPPEVAALFPDSFEESELGMVPRGWKVVSVGDVAEVVKGKSYSSKDLVDSHDTALVTLKSFERGGGFRLDGFKPYSGAYKPSQVVVPGDLIIAYTDVTQAAELIGKPAIVVGVENHQTLVASLDVGIVRPVEDNVSRQFLYGLFRTEPFQSHTFAHTSGTTVLHLAKDGVGSFEFACPPVELVKAFTEIADSLAERRQTNIDQMRTLATLRDTLLPRLISGQLRLSDAEAQLSETGLCQ
ncbi:restriction endonuclease subunit S [Aeromonas allosaccharophila]|uniref:Restriction endonuclease subunit S n=1 Tax=Aeromonas allosaccharophila TaxID=656 RepID=A0AAX3NSY3_9GAMM|nr:restriction endonuclease subunit S [Aeromonas allosaccharophila]WED77248.1 restriction endonuclease subunit S [Aeromonas allosaccharophila]